MVSEVAYDRVGHEIEDGAYYYSPLTTYYLLLTADCLLRGDLPS